jgi:hypothetical protein
MFRENSSQVHPSLFPLAEKNACSMPCRCVGEKRGYYSIWARGPFIQSVPERNDARLFRFFAYSKPPNSERKFMPCVVVSCFLNAVLFVVVGEKSIVQKRILLRTHWLIPRATLGDLGAEVCSNDGDKSGEPPCKSRITSLKAPRVE